VANMLVAEELDHLVVRLDSEEKRFPLGDIETPWVLLQRIKEVFSFLQDGLRKEDVDLKKTEYAAINGMLQTLDPHSSFLDPDHYREMKDKTQGKFGGLGIVISIRDGVLTIISPLAGTPADLAGLEAGDQILKIGEMSTVNMSLNDAVSLLRGDPDTKITIHVLRKGWAEPHPFTIVRAIIKVESLETRFLTGSVGYVKIKDFQVNTPKDLQNILQDWDAKHIRGLIIDLRGCPGGLLEAAIRTSDTFLKKGVIVTTAGQGPRDRDVRRATDSGNEPTYPIVVLLNGGSASASEILAGALKNHNRALLLGERTFGKGSVQVLYDFHDGSALKLTTAQYLTPGDISIQSVGIAPHVELNPMRADREMLDLTMEAGYRESDLKHHLEEKNSSKTSNQFYKSLSYLLPAPKKKKEESKKAASLRNRDKEFKPDFAIKLASNLIIKTSGLSGSKIDREELLATIKKTEKAEDEKLVSALKKLGIDWTMGDSESVGKLLSTVRLAEKGPLVAGEESKLIVQVTNEGPGSFFRLFARSRSDFYPLTDRELAFGKVGPGQTVERELTFKVPKDAVEQTDDILWTFTEAGGRKLDAIAIRVSVKDLPRPKFAYSMQINDVDGGNGDSILQPGESAKLLVDIKNVGEGVAFNTYATLKSLQGKGLFMIRGRESLGEIKPQEHKRGIFEFEIKPAFGEHEVQFELALAAVDLKVYSLETIRIPLAKPSAVTPLNKKLVTLPSLKAVQVLDRPNNYAKQVATFSRSTKVKVDAETTEFYRVVLDGERNGWIYKEALVSDTEGTVQPAQMDFRSSPKLTVEETPQVVTTSTVKLRGKATDETRVRNIYIFVGNDKVFFTPNSHKHSPRTLSFEAELPLKNGLNYITVVAEETADLNSRKTIVIRRDRPDSMPYFLSRSISKDPEPVGVIPFNSVFQQTISKE
jgi:carboxyl-terminal processing protease